MLGTLLVGHWQSCSHVSAQRSGVQSSIACKEPLQSAAQEVPAGSATAGSAGAVASANAQVASCMLA